MKRLRWVAFFTLLAVAVPAWAGVGIGLKAGANFSNPKSDRTGIVERESRMGLMAGLALTFPLTPTDAIFLRTEGLYVARDWKETGRLSNNVGYSRLLTTNELVFAPFLVMRFNPGGVTPFLEVGPELGVTLSHEAENEIEDASRLSELQEIEDWGRTNVNLNFGGGLVFPAGAGELLLEGRYNLGLTDYDFSDDVVVARTRGFQFLIGYNFNAPTWGAKKDRDDDDDDDDTEVEVEVENEDDDDDDD